MAKADYYQLLGVGKTASQDELKKAYRKLAMKYHPDRNPDDAAAEAKFKEVTEAYEILKDDQRRAAYDQFGHAAFEQGGGGGGRGGAAGGFDFSSFSDVFDDLFGDFGGGGGRRRGARRGADLRYNMSISLEDAFEGKKTTIRVPGTISCESCGGDGCAEGSAPKGCPTCRGQGVVRAQQGFFTVERTCPTCQGAGKVISDPCRLCSGTGQTQKEKTLAITIPRGVEDGTRIRLSGEGDAGNGGGPPGDLYIFISVDDHAFFQRDGRNISCRVPLPMTKAALGGDIEVPTIDGKRSRVKIPAGTQNGHKFRMRGVGMTELQGSGNRGDMYVEIQVETPVKLTKRQEELLREFAEESGESGHNPQSEGWFAKVKDLWDGNVA